MAIDAQKSWIFNKGFAYKGKKKVRPAGSKKAFPIFKEIGLRKEASWPPFFWMKHNTLIAADEINLINYFDILRLH